MIRVMGHLSLMPRQVEQALSDFDSWPAWMSGVDRVQVLAKREGRAHLATWQNFRGKEFYQELEVTDLSSGLRLRQTKGTLERWDATWQFQPSPDGDGTTLCSEINVDVGGMMGMFVPQRMIEEFIEKAFHDSIARLAKRAGNLMAEIVEPPNPGDDVILQLYETSRGLEVWHQGKLYPIEGKLR